MATLPDGGSVSSQITEGWNFTDPVSGASSQIVEGWNFSDPVSGAASQIYEGWDIIRSYFDKIQVKP